MPRREQHHHTRAKRPDFALRRSRRGSRTRRRRRRTCACKDPKDWKLAGKPTQRLDVLDKVLGRPIYGIDVRVPAMLYAALAQCPVFRGTLKSVDETAAAGMKGIHKVVKLKDAVAVVADGWWQAKKALDALTITWDDGGNGAVSSASIRDFLRAGLTSTDAGVGRREGDLADGFAKTAKRIEADYDVPFLGHATMEPQNCTAHVTGNTRGNLGSDPERRGGAGDGR